MTPGWLAKEKVVVAIAILMRADVVAATIAQAGAIGNQGGSSNLQKFEAYDPPTLKGGGDLMVASHCFQLVIKDTGASAMRNES